MVRRGSLLVSLFFMACAGLVSAQSEAASLSPPPWLFGEWSDSTGRITFRFSEANVELVGTGDAARLLFMPTDETIPSGYTVTSATMGLSWQFDAAGPNEITYTVVDSGQPGRAVALMRRGAAVAAMPAPARAESSAGTAKTAAPQSGGAASATAASTGPDLSPLVRYSLENADTAVPYLGTLSVHDLQQLVSAGLARLDETTSGEETLLMAAAASGDLELTRYLLARGLNVNAVDAERRSPLFYAVYAGGTEDRSEIISTLISAGAALESHGPNGWTPLILAAMYNVPESVDTLLKAGADPNDAGDGYQGTLYFGTRGPAGLNGIADVNPVRVIEQLLRAGANASAADDDGFTPLMEASRQALPDVVRALLAAGAKPNSVNSAGRTAIFYAAEGIPLAKHPDEFDAAAASVIGLLAATGADVNFADPAGETPLSTATERYHGLAVVKALLASGAAVDGAPSTINGWTPMMIACGKGHMDVAETLRAAGANLEIQDHAGHSAGDICHFK